jgi:VanZ family protein
VAVAHLRLHPATPVAWTDLLLFAPAGALGVLLWVERGGRRWPGAAAATVGLGLVWGSVEALRGAAGGDLAPNAVLLRTAATLVGATLAAAALRHDATRVSDADRDAGRDATAGDGWPWLARRGPAAFAALLLLWSWRPFDLVTAPAAIAAKLGGDAFVPLAALAGQYTLHSVADVGVSFLLYVPVGAWLAARRAARGALRALGPGFGLALAAEAGQAFVGERTVDVTDVLVQCAGVFVGWAVLRQAEGLKRAALHPGDGRDRGTERDAWAHGYGQADAYGDVDTATRRRAHELA